MTGTRQAKRLPATGNETIRHWIIRSVAIPGTIVAGLGLLAGCASLSTPTDAPDWYKSRVNEKSAKRVPRFAELEAPVAPLPKTLEWQRFADDLARMRAVMAARAAEASIPPAESLAMFRVRVQALIAPGLIPLANDAPPVSPPRPLPVFAE